MPRRTRPWRASSPRSASSVSARWGAGIAEVFARNGFAVVGVEADDGASERGREHLQHSTARAVARGKLTEAEQQAAARPDHVHHRAGGPRRRRPRRRGGRRSSSSSSRRSSRELDAIVQPDAILATNTSSPVGHRDLGRHRPTRAGSSACTSSTRRRCRSSSRSSGPWSPSRDVLDDVEALVERLGKNARRLGDKAGFIANALLFGYLNHAVSMYEAQLRHPRGHRRRDAARLRLPDGPAGAARPDRSRHGVRDPRHDVQAGPRPAARADARSSSRWSPPACCGRKTGRGFYTYDEPGSARSSSPTR